MKTPHRSSVAVSSYEAALPRLNRGGGVRQLAERLAAGVIKNKMLSDPIADFCTRIRNGYMAKKKDVVIPFSKIKEKIAKILVQEGYLKNVKCQMSNVKNEKLKIKDLVVELKYDEDGKPAVMAIERISKPGLRVYKKAKKLPKVLSGLGIAIVSTPCGIMTDRQARKKNLGGEVLFQVW